MCKKITAWALAALSVCSLAAGCKKKPDVQALTPTNGECVALVNEQMQSFVSNYKYASSHKYAMGKDYFAPVGVTLSWKAKGTPIEYEIVLSTDESLQEAVTFTTTETTYTVENLFVNYPYYWQVTAKYAEGEKTSETYAFTTANTPRTIDIEGVSNTRDIGGKLTADGKRVKQNMLFRSAYLDEVTEKGAKAFLETYGIKTELDVRREGEGSAGKGSPLGPNVRYINYSFPYYTGGDTGLDVPANYANIAAAVKVFADEDNYPMLFHCAIGRDRTGMLSMLLLGLLGVSSEDISLDYETSAFSKTGSQDGASMLSLTDRFTETVGYILMDTGKRDFQEACEAYLLAVGVTQEELDSIKNIMLEENKLPIEAETK